MCFNARVMMILWPDCLHKLAPCPGCPDHTPTSSDKVKSQPHKTCPNMLKEQSWTLEFGTFCPSELCIGVGRTENMTAKF